MATGAKGPVSVGPGKFRTWMAIYVIQLAVLCVYDFDRRDCNLHTLGVIRIVKWTRVVDEEYLNFRLVK